MAWGWLGKLAKIGGLAAAPFTGGASLALSALGTAGDVASGISKGRAQGRMAQGDFNLRSGEAQQSANTSTAATNLAQRRHEAQMRARALSDTLRGGLLQSTHDATISGLPQGVSVPTITGGMRPSNLGGTAAALGPILSAQGFHGLTNPDIKPDMTPFDFNNLAPKPSRLDKLLNIVGGIGSVAGGLSPYLTKPIKTRAGNVGGTDEDDGQ